MYLCPLSPVLFAVYAAPNMFMPLLVNVVSSSEQALWPTTLTLVGGMALGAWLSYFGISNSWCWLLLIGRLVFG